DAESPAAVARTTPPCRGRAGSRRRRRGPAGVRPRRPPARRAGGFPAGSSRPSSPPSACHVTSEQHYLLRARVVTTGVGGEDGCAAPSEARLPVRPADRFLFA